MNKAAERLYNGIIKENPTFVLTLGMCPTLAVTTSAVNGLSCSASLGKQCYKRFRLTTLLYQKPVLLSIERICEIVRETP